MKYAMLELTGSMFSLDTRCLGCCVDSLHHMLLAEVLSEHCESII